MYCDVLQKQDEALRIIVEGNAGYGKTTLAARVAYDWASGADYLKDYSHAFLIYLRELRGSIDEHIKTLHYPQEQQDADAFLGYIKTNTERVLFIFDGYDELPKEQREPIDQIMSGRAYARSGAVLTSRPMQMPFKTFCKSVSLTGFDEAKKAEFVRLVYGDRPQMRIEDFLVVLERGPEHGRAGPVSAHVSAALRDAPARQGRRRRHQIAGVPGVVPLPDRQGGAPGTPASPGRGQRATGGLLPRGAGWLRRLQPAVSGQRQAGVPRE